VFCESAESDPESADANRHQLAQDGVQWRADKEKREKMYYLNRSVKISFVKRLHFHEFIMHLLTPPA
jgi:hypothetical protein